MKLLTSSEKKSPVPDVAHMVWWHGTDVMSWEVALASANVSLTKIRPAQTNSLLWWTRETYLSGTQTGWRQVLVQKGSSK